MKKKIFAFMMLFIMVIHLTGCMRITYHITLNKNATADVSYEMYINKETLPMIVGADTENQDFFADNKKGATDAGFEVEDVETETEIGFKASAKKLNLNMQNVISQLGMGGTGDGVLQVKRGLFKNVYTLNANVDTSDVFGDDENAKALLPALNQSIAIKLIITAPSEIISEGGTPSTTMKNTHEYDIVLGENNEISISYSLINMTNIYIICGVLIITLLIVFFVIKAKKKGVDIATDEEIDIFDEDAVEVQTEEEEIEEQKEPEEQE